MYNSVVKLNDQQFAELNTLAGLLTNRYKIEQIICFGVLHAHEENKTCFITQYQETENFYYLLVIATDSVKMKCTMQDFVNKRYHRCSCLCMGQRKLLKQPTYKTGFS